MLLLVHQIILYNEELYDLHRSSNITRIYAAHLTLLGQLKERESARHITQLGETRNSYKFFVKRKA
jgi:hypothetical protein